MATTGGVFFVLSCSKLLLEACVRKDSVDYAFCDGYHQPRNQRKVRGFGEIVPADPAITSILELTQPGSSRRGVKCVGIEDDRSSQPPLDNPGLDSRFEKIFKRFFAPLVGFFRNRGLSGSDSEDLAQEVLLRAFRYLPEYRAEASLSTWIFKIADSVWRNDFRRQRAHIRRGRNISIDSDAETLREDSWAAEAAGKIPDDQLRELLIGEKRDVARDAIERLPKRMNECVTLFIYGGFSYKEISELLEIRLNTVKSTISQARVKLGEYLRRHHPELFYD